MSLTVEILCSSYKVIDVDLHSYSPADVTLCWARFNFFAGWPCVLLPKAPSTGSLAPLKCHMGRSTVGCWVTLLDLIWFISGSTKSHQSKHIFPTCSQDVKSNKIWFLLWSADRVTIQKDRPLLEHTFLSYHERWSRHKRAKRQRMFTPVCFCYVDALNTFNSLTAVCSRIVCLLTDNWEAFCCVQGIHSLE